MKAKKTVLLVILLIGLIIFVTIQNRGVKPLEFIQSLNAARMVKLSVLEEHTYISGNEIVFSPDGKWLLYQNDRGKPRLRNVEDQNDFFDLTRNELSSDITDLDFSSNGNIVVASYSGYINGFIVWNIETKQEEFRINLPNVKFASIAINENLSKIVSGSTDGIVRLWDEKTAQLLSSLNGHSSVVRVVAFSPDGSLIISGSDDHTIRVWETETGKLLNVLLSHTQGITDVAFSPDGKLVAASSRDMTISLWDITTFKLIGQPFREESIVSAIAFNPDGKLFASRSMLGPIRLWGILGG